MCVHASIIYYCTLFIFFSSLIVFSVLYFYVQCLKRFLFHVFCIYYWNTDISYKWREYNIAWRVYASHLYVFSDLYERTYIWIGNNKHRIFSSNTYSIAFSHCSADMIWGRKIGTDIVMSPDLPFFYLTNAKMEKKQIIY